MPKPKQFDQEKTIQKAMRLFWTQGYEATSIQDLVETLDLSRSSIYDTFGDKHQLFLQALDNYRQLIVQNIERLLMSDQPFPALLVRLFDQFINDAQGRTRGCFMVNSIAELAPQDPEVVDIAARYSGEVRQLLTQALAAAQARGEIRTNTEPEALALFLFNNLQGLRILLKSEQDTAQLVAVRDLTLAVLT